MQLKAFRLRTALAVVAVLAIGTAALRDASPVWASLALGAVVLVLALAVLTAIYRRGPDRAWWIGFSVFGWCYLGLIFGPLGNSESTPHAPTTLLLYRVHDTVSPPSLAADAPSPALLDRISGLVAEIDGFVSRGATPMARDLARTAYDFRDYLSAKDHAVLLRNRNLLAPQEQAALQITPPAPVRPFWMGPPAWGSAESFVAIGHCLFALLAALIGAVFARGLERGRLERGRS